MKTIRVPYLLCLRCGHQWIPRRDRRPGVCPICKRYDWDKKPEKTRAKDIGIEKIKQEAI